MQHRLTTYRWRTGLAVLLMLMVLPFAQATDVDTAHHQFPILVGTIDSVHLENRTVVYMDMVYTVALNADIRSVNGFPITLADIKPNTRVQVGIIPPETPDQFPIINKIHVLK